ncbi:MAG: hypothetical protein ACT4OZ_11265 [Gemmatimonadota bacterium]
MKIDGRDSGPVRPGRHAEIAGRSMDGGGTRQKPRPNAQSAERPDRVEISSVGRSRAASLTPVPHTSPDRLAEVRRRLLIDAYNSDDVAGEVARRIVDRADI